MKKILISIVIVFFALSCSSINDSDSDKDEQFISIILSKDNFEDTLGIVDTSFLTGAIYFPVDSIGYTSVSLFNYLDAEPYHLSIAFPGNQVGMVNWSNSRWNLIHILKKEGDPIPIYITYDGYTDITRYGSIGERIEGSLYGLLVEMSTRDTLAVEG